MKIFESSHVHEIEFEGVFMRDQMFPAALSCGAVLIEVSMCP
jgi:hypothetical protein